MPNLTALGRSKPGWVDGADRADNAHSSTFYQTHNAPPAARLVDADRRPHRSEIGKPDAIRLDAMGLRRAETVHVKAGGTTLRRSGGSCSFPRASIRRRDIRRWSRSRRTGVQPPHRPRELAWSRNPLARRVPDHQPRTRARAGDRQADARCDLPEARADEIDDMGRRVFFSKALSRSAVLTRTRVRDLGTSSRLRVGDCAAAPSGGVRRAASASPPHRNCGTTTPSTRAYMWIQQENRGARRRQRDDLSKDSQGEAADSTTPRRTTSPPAKLAAVIKALQDAASASTSGRHRPRPQPGEAGSDDGVLIEALRP